MIESVPFCAPMSPPLTGASRKSQPRASASRASFRTAIGETVLMSISSIPGRAPSNTPSLPLKTCSTSGVSGSIVITTSLFCAISFGVSHHTAPSASKSSILDRVRVSTLTG